MENFIELNTDNIESEYICCAISDKKCADSYQVKKDWLKSEFKKGYVFRLLDESDLPPKNRSSMSLLPERHTKQSPLQVGL